MYIACWGTFLVPQSWNRLDYRAHSSLSTDVLWHSPSHIPNTLPHSFPIFPIFLLPMPERACLEIAELFPWFVYTYAGFWTWPVKNVKHQQLLVPQILGFSRTSHANPGNMHIHGKLLTRRINLRRWNRGLRRFWDSKVVLGSFLSFQYCLILFYIFLHHFSTDFIHSFFPLSGQ